MRKHAVSRPTYLVPLLGLLALLLPQVLPAAQSEQLHYRVSYQGFFSAGARLSIADVILSTRQPASESAYAETEMQVSSEAYGAVEAFYPIRYRFRSWYLPDRSASLAFEYWQRKRSGKLKHRLTYLDDPQEPFITRDLQAEGELDLPSLLAGDYPAAAPQSPRFDRLGLLQRVRSLPLQVGQQVELPVTTGKAMLHYRVSVEAEQQLQIAGQSWSALKLRFDGLEPDDRGKLRHSHRPVFIWLSNDAQRLPLRADSKHTLGRFTLEMVLPGQSQAPPEPPAPDREPDSQLVLWEH